MRASSHAASGCGRPQCPFRNENTSGRKVERASTGSISGAGGRESPQDVEKQWRGIRRRSASFCAILAPEEAGLLVRGQPQGHQVDSPMGVRE